MQNPVTRTSATSGRHIYELMYKLILNKMRMKPETNLKRAHTTVSSFHSQKPCPTLVEKMLFWPRGSLGNSVSPRCTKIPHVKKCTFRTSIGKINV